MRILVCEYVTGGGLRDRSVPPDLLREGEAMRRALVKDLAARPGVLVSVTLDERLAIDSPAAHVIGEGQSLEAVLPDLLKAFDAFWPVAPESDGALARLCQIGTASCRVLASDPETITLCASKLATATHLARHGLPSVPTWTAGAVGESSSGWIVKPDDGAGCQDTRYAATRAELDLWLTRTPSAVVQPFVPGEPASLSLLCRDGQAQLLACNRQTVSRAGGRLRYDGSHVGALETARARFEPLAQAIAAALPGLWGYVGVDLVDSDTGPQILEINPRLTTSYVGLGDWLGVNPAGLVLKLLEQPRLATAAHG